ncbi:hypothetical protein QW131_29075 [Roseibium salinum]|nr:hypothetical protein [Roseibium salinum]
MLVRALSRFPLAVKLGSFSFLMILLLAVSAVIGIRAMSTIGHELTGVAEHDLVLTNSVSHLTEMQLEQAILFERAIRLGQEAANGNRHAYETFTAVREKFVELAHAADEELARALEKVRTIKAETNGEDELAEWEHVIEALGHIDQAHRIFRNRRRERDRNNRP